MRRRISKRIRALRKLVALPPGDWWWIARAQWRLVHARVLLAVRERGRLVEPEPVTATLAAGDLAHARRCALMIRRAARFGLFRPSCLVQSLALVSLLTAEGIAGARIRVGVRQRDGAIQAHAWVEYGGEVIGDFDEHVASFTELTDVRLVERSP